ncbi:uncharacterized protein LOC106671904 [Cimex lectularius]|uniref:Uncharacterized protein n=1 Tax=Cimex lectularius TaxID=79782 RepID=A0A8I6SCY3_CIMLE|nr:uncharacterized protein LOC106671904 [Cimex lectularius]
MHDESMMNQGEMTQKNKTGVVTNIFTGNESDADLISDISPSDGEHLQHNDHHLDRMHDHSDNQENEVTHGYDMPVREEDDRRVDASEEEYDTYFCGSPSTSIITNEDEKAAEANTDIGSEDERESFHMRYSDIFENWQYSEDERNWLRYKVEMLNRNQCVVFCILGHIMMTREEMQGIRHAAPNPDDARQALLTLCIGSQWDVRNLAILMAFQDKVSVVEKYVSTLLIVNPYKARSLIRYMLMKML